VTTVARHLRGIPPAPASDPLLPTPTPSNPNGGESPQTFLDRQRTYAASHGGSYAGPPLGMVVRMLPTPMARDHKGAGYGTEPGRPLSETVLGRLLPTPTVVDYKGSNPLERTRDGKPRPLGDDDLPTAVERLFPTPRASDGAKGCPQQRGSSGDMMLSPVAIALSKNTVSLLPTPTAMDSHGSRNATSGRHSETVHHPGTTLTDWAWQQAGWTGDSTPGRSPDGKPCQDVPLPLPPSPEPEDSPNSPPPSSSG
jgi:hypothetical protein